MRTFVRVMKWVLGIGVVVALVGGGAGLMLWPAVKKQMEKSREGARGEMVRLAAIESGELVRTVSAPAYLEATRRVQISARFSAQIMELPFEEGMQVRADDVVVRLDDRDLRAQLESAEASQKAEEARLEGARASYVNAVAEWERQSALHKTNDVSKQALDMAETEKNRSEAALRAAEASVAIAKANISRVLQELRYTEIRSPIDGVVTTLNAKVGEVVVTGTMNNPGTVILEVADLSEMIVKCEVDESDIAEIRAGQKIRVALNAYADDEFEARVTKIALQRTKARDLSECFLVEGLMDLEGKTLLSGLTGSVDVEVETVKGVLLAPSQAVLDVRVDELPREVVDASAAIDKNKTFARVVYRLEDGEAKATPVRIGPSDLRTTALVAGIDAGTRVIVGPYKALQSIKHGQKVRDEEAEKKAEEEKNKKPGEGEAAPEGTEQTATAAADGKKSS
ncbi:MAG: efflux RND transporter periplasmic adaptor subunit [Phycisphaerales bacterium]